MHLKRRDLESYDEKVEAVCSKAEDAALKAYDTMRKTDMNMSVSDVREGVKAIVEGVAWSYGDMACEAAAEFYDTLAERSGAKVREAYIPEVSHESLDVVDSQTRYYVGLLVDEREDI